MPGTRLGHYRILERIGAGGMGEVYRAHDEQLDRDVAIKVLPAASAGDAVARARLLREARAAAALKHPSICTIHEVSDAGDQAYIAMELVEGAPLGDRLQGRALPVAETLRHGIQIADALAHAHSRHIVHRDLKSANIIVGPDGRLTVLDFGLARRMEGHELSDVTTAGPGGAALTERGVVAGTLAYMAPEQLRGASADARSDIWALGVVLYEMAAGVRPFAGQSAFELSARILNDPPTALPSSVPVPLRAVIEKCLDKEPARRYQAASEVRAALEATQSGAAAPAIAVRYHLTRRPWLAAGVAAALAVAVAAGVYWDDIRTRWPGGAPRVDSLAVLPLVNLSGDAEQEYLADGITEVLSTDLARLGGLRRVTARSSVIRYKASDKPLADIARELGVDALLTGSVLRSGDRVSITAQLLDPSTGDQLWSNRYDRDFRDVLTVRNEIVSAIVAGIHAQLSPGERARLAAAQPVNPEVFEAILKGRFHWAKQTAEDFNIAERYFQNALNLEPRSALALAGLGSVWMMRGDAGFQPPAEAVPKARAYFDRALALDDEQAEVHMRVGNRAAIEWDWAGAERSYRRAIELNPNLADARFFYADLLLVLRRPQEWDREIQRALELDPLNDFNRSFYGWELNYVKRYDEAIAVFQQLLPTGPNKASNYLGLWGAYHRTGRYEQALAAARDYYLTLGQRDFADALGSGRDAAAYREGMRRTGEAMVERSKSAHVPAVRIARMFAHAGDADRALHWLERAFENREPSLLRIEIFWDWLDLHRDPRFQDLVRRIGLPR
jgi:TolB-like protein/tetratricopeptide (TPR) repeat protein